MSEQQIKINRPLVGILALACLGAALAIWLTYPNEEAWQMWLAGFVRVGLVMSAFWLALPSRGREAAWANVSPQTFVIFILAVVALMRLPLKIVLPIFAIVAAIGFVLRPREKPRPRSHVHR